MTSRSTKATHRRAHLGRPIVSLLCVQHNCKPAYEDKVLAPPINALSICALPFDELIDCPQRAQTVLDVRQVDGAEITAVKASGIVGRNDPNCARCDTIETNGPG